MGRNKYPEQTIEHILDASTKLFIEKGYDKTSIQDIMDMLGLSKGAIYHHFTGKEEILEVVIKRRSDYAAQMLKDLIVNTQAVNAKEKIQKILLSIASDKEIHAINRILCSQIKSPQFVVAGIKSNVKDDADYISQLLSEGIADGSIQTDYPVECAEIFMMLLNIWTNPVLFNRNQLQTKQRLIALQQIMKQLGVDILSEELIDQLIFDYNSMGGFNVSK
ncbi:TetR family transcriptional regulator [Anaerocolumna sedimenticola]|uniref:TetR family transcriptional regulator n=1 Tax=Anaerocolumna sedimenticola TaxID=2696063 RepID=A0A6P1TRX9_9FIRM|nr:TetR/AcrR family transcriptional regulator [Anaerocolumna sedimenticola]QHQ62691.1 TetR family transcriptional regulator [Anaerocolumna sedimenticola]